MKSWFRSALPMVLATLVIVGVSSIWLAPPAHACSCVPPPPPEEALEDAEDVFTGEVVDITSIDDGTRYEVRFEVSEAWKGIDHQEITVATANNSAACGYNFEAGQDYLVYTYENSSGTGPETETGLCQRNADLASASEDLDALGEGTPGTDLQSVEADERNGDTDVPGGIAPWLLGGGGTLVAFTLLSIRVLRG